MYIIYYSNNGGVYQGKQLLSEESINRMQQISSGGIDLAFSMDGMWSVGPMVFPIVESGKPVSILILVYEMASAVPCPQIEPMGSFFISGSFIFLTLKINDSL
jgi:hypothetical protein